MRSWLRSASVPTAPRARRCRRRGRRRAEGGHRLGAADRSRSTLAAHRRSRPRLGRLAVGLGRPRLEQRRQRQRRRRRRSPRPSAPGPPRRVGGDRDELGAVGQQVPGEVRVVGEDRGADDEDQVVAGERLGDRADRRRQHAAEVRVALGEAEPAAAGRRDRPDRQALPLGERDGVRPSPRRRRCRGRRRAPGSPRRRAARRGRRSRSGAAPARPLTRRAIACAEPSSSASAVQSSIGIETNAGPLRRQRQRCGSRGRARRARRRPAAARSST